MASEITRDGFATDRESHGRRCGPAAGAGPMSARSHAEAIRETESRELAGGLGTVGLDEVLAGVEARRAARLSRSGGSAPSSPHGGGLKDWK